MDVYASVRCDLPSSFFISFPIAMGSGRYMKQKKDATYESIKQD
jgi:hypothetical protein